jgi:transposase-like protein
MKYSQERKEAVLKKMLPPTNQPIAQLSKSEGIAEATLYNWRMQARNEGRLLPDVNSTPEGWTSKDKFAAVLETAVLSEAEIAQYCRRRGLYPEQLSQWRQACEHANDWSRSMEKQLQETSRSDRKKLKTLEQELARKEKALAEAAALLVLQKKFNAMFEGNGED